MKMEYGFEYMGCRALPVFTPRMNNYMISLMQVSTLTDSRMLKSGSHDSMQGMESGRHSLVSGPRDSGKEEIMGGVAQLMGKFLFVYPCTAHSDTHTLARIMEGLAQVQNIPSILFFQLLFLLGIFSGIFLKLYFVQKRIL